MNQSAVNFFFISTGAVNLICAINPWLLIVIFFSFLHGFYLYNVGISITTCLCQTLDLVPYLRRWVHGELQLRLLPIVHGQALHHQGGETRASASTKAEKIFILSINCDANCSLTNYQLNWFIFQPERTRAVTLIEYAKTPKEENFIRSNLLWKYSHQ